MGQITTDAADVFRDMESPGSSVPHEPVKSEIRDLFATIDEEVEALDVALTDAQIATRRGYVTWVAMAADSSQPAGTVGEVPTSDAGTHTDPVVGGTVNNSGTFVYSTSPAGWRRVGDYAVTALANQSEVDAGVVSTKAIAPDTYKVNADERMATERRLRWVLDRQLPSATAPVIVEYTEDNRLVFTLRPADAHYRDGHTRRYDDIVQFELKQLAGTYHPAGFQIWTLLSIWTRFSGVWVPQANFSWGDMAGSLFDTRLTASTNEQVWFYGKTADSAAAITAAGGSAPYHGNIVASFNPTFGVTGGIKNGAVIPDGTNVFATFLPGETITCSQFDLSQNWGYKTPDGTIGGALGLLHRFAPLTGQQLTISSQIPFGAAGYHATVAYSAMMAQRVANKVQARSTAGVAGSVQDCGLGAGASLSFGSAARVTTWSTTAIGALDVELNSTYAPYRVGGVQAAYSVPAFGLDNAAGLKVYFPIFQGSTDLDDVTSKTYSQLVYYNGVYADGA